jgi:RHH-type proline utilization regulon transcriptional repressor/proline dehydrogenase/delta 1-pyrroline-5-carboxylate dehydrogenase
VDIDRALAGLSSAAPGAGGADRGTVLAALGERAGHEAKTLAVACARAIEEGSERELAGPTGERNTWRTHPRGLTVALGNAGGDALVWLGQAMAAVAAGNPVLLVPAGDAMAAARVAALVKSAGWNAIAVAADAADRWASIPSLAAVLAADPVQAKRAAIAVAARPGARIPVVEPAGTPWTYPVWRLETERTVSVNTVAAGGNAHLLAQMD